MEARIPVNGRRITPPPDKQHDPVCNLASECPREAILCAARVDSRIRILAFY